MKKLILFIAFAVACFGQAQPGLRLAVCNDAGANDTYTCTAAPTVTSYTGLKVLLTVNTANTGAATLNIDSVGAKAVVKIAGGISTALSDNDLVPKGTYILIYNATDDDFKVISATGTVAAGGSSNEYWESFNTAMRSLATQSMCCGWSTGYTNGGSVAHVNGDANYVATAATLADGSDTHHIWRGVVPRNFTGQTVTAKFYWMATSGTTNSIMTEVSTAFVGPGGSYVPSYNTAQATTSASGGNNIENVITLTLDMTGADAGDAWYIRFMRDGDGASDNNTATINLMRMELYY